MSVTNFYVLTDYGTFTNCFCNYNHGVFYDTEKPIKIIANEGYEFTNNNFTWSDGTNPAMTFKNNGDYLEITNFNENDLEYFMLNNDYIATKKIETGIKVNLTGTFENCYCNYSDGGFYNEEKQLKIIANEGYTFKDSYSWYGGVYTQNLINNTTYLSIPIELPSDTTEITLNDNYIATKKPKTTNTFTNIYLTNIDELNQLAIKRFDEKDYSNFILNLYEIPFKIDEDISDVETTIKLGLYDTGINTHLITERYVSFNLGSITVEEKYNNVYDYINTECILHLPYFNSVYINNEYVINRTLEIEYIIDLYTNTCIANIKSSFSNEIVESLNTQIGNIIPFIQQNSLIGNFSLSFNNNKIPYIEVIRNIPYNVNTIFGGETIEYGVIGDYEGFTRCENVLLNSRATNKEKEEIMKLLNEGVIL